MKKERGVTLIEIVVAGGLGALVVSGAGAMLIQSMRSYIRATNVLETQDALLEAQSYVSRVHRRGIQFFTVSMGPPPPGFLVSGNGAIVVHHDSRECNDFNPATSTAPANQTVSAIACCAPNQTIIAPVPARVPGNRVTNRCGARGGLSVEEFQGGASVLARCYPEVSRIDVAEVGFDRSTGSALRSLLITGRSDAQGRVQSLEDFHTLGNTGQQRNVVCRMPVLSQMMGPLTLPVDPSVPPPSGQSPPAKGR